MKTINTPISFSITDGIRTPDGHHYVRIKGPRGLLWIGHAALFENETSVRKRVSQLAGLHLFTAAAISQFKEAVQSWTEYREGQVADFVGWVGDDFVCGDGRIYSPAAEPSTVGISFEPNPKFSPLGSLENWQANVEPFVLEHPIPYFALAFALSGPLLQFMPPHVLNPQLELVGEGKSGKTTIGILAASVWAGSSRSVGGGESLDMTPGFLDRHREMHRDMFLLLDEAENARNPEQRKELVGAIAFKASSTEGKKRLTDTSTTPMLKLPLIMTTNTALSDVLLREGTDSREAAISRVLSLRLAKIEGNGAAQVFETVPNGFGSIHQAVKKMRRVSVEAYGTAGPAFAGWLARQRSDNEAALRAEIDLLLENASDRLSRLDPTIDERHRYMLAVIEVAAVYAQRAGVVPENWGNPASVIDQICLMLAGMQPPVKRTFDVEWQRFRTYLDEQTRMRKLMPIDTPLIPNRRVKEGVPGFVRRARGRTEIFIDPKYLDQTFGASAAFLAEARAGGRLVVAASEADRLRTHPPKPLAAYGFGRVYAFRI